jgi:hypothetical protein
LKLEKERELVVEVERTQEDLNKYPCKKEEFPC